MAVNIADILSSLGGPILQGAYRTITGYTPSTNDLNAAFGGSTLTGQDELKLSALGAAGAGGLALGGGAGLISAGRSLIADIGQSGSIAGSVSKLVPELGGAYLGGSAITSLITGQTPTQILHSVLTKKTKKQKKAKRKKVSKRRLT